MKYDKALSRMQISTLVRQDNLQLIESPTRLRANYLARPMYRLSANIVANPFQAYVQVLQSPKIEVSRDCSSYCVIPNSLSEQPLYELASALKISIVSDCLSKTVKIKGRRICVDDRVHKFIC